MDLCMDLAGPDETYCMRAGCMLVHVALWVVDMHCAGPGLLLLPAGQCWASLWLT